MSSIAARPKPRSLPETARPAASPTQGIEPIDESAADRLARTLSALADPVRIRLLSIVASRGEVCSCELIEPLAKSQPTISHHTTILANAGLLVGEKRGRGIWWHVDDQALSDVRHALGESIQ